MVTKVIYFHGNPIELECNVKATEDGKKEVHLTDDQMTSFIAKILNEMCSYVESGLRTINAPKAQDYGKSVSAPMKPTPSKPRVVNETTGKPAFTEEQKTKMRDIKNRLKVKHISELDQWIRDWSGNQRNSWKELNTSNIDDFIEYMYKNAM